MKAQETYRILLLVFMLAISGLLAVQLGFAQDEQEQTLEQTTPAFDVRTIPKQDDGYARITADLLHKALESKDFTLVNVHIPLQGDIPQTDHRIPFNEVADNLDKLPDKEQPIVVYCRSGSMSAAVSRKLVNLGYTKIIDVIGGTNAWKEAGYELVTEEND